MILTIDNVIPADLLERARAVLAEAEWTDGAQTAAGSARGAKHNRQAKWGIGVEELQTLIARTVCHHEAFAKSAFLAKASQPIFNRYDVGDSYGPHFDTVLMGGPLRTDLSVTVFLSRPDEYDGGGLVISGGDEHIKLPAGSVIVYPSTVVHEVMPVTRGTRLAAIFWVQSMIRDEGQRDLMHELTALVNWANVCHPGPEALRLSQVRANLFRRWID